MQDALISPLVENQCILHLDSNVGFVQFAGVSGKIGGAVNDNARSGTTYPPLRFEVSGREPIGAIEQMAKTKAHSPALLHVLLLCSYLPAIL
eukprot:gene9509-1748_t